MWWLSVPGQFVVGSDLLKAGNVKAVLLCLGTEVTRAIKLQSCMALKVFFFFLEFAPSVHTQPTRPQLNKIYLMELNGRLLDNGASAAFVYSSDWAPVNLYSSACDHRGEPLLVYLQEVVSFRSTNLKMHINKSMHWSWIFLLVKSEIWLLTGANLQ